MGAGPLGIVAGVVVTLALTAALEVIGLSALGQRNLGVALLVAFGLTMVVPALGDKVSGALAPSIRVGARLPRGGDGFVGGALMGTGSGLSGRRAPARSSARSPRPTPPIPPVRTRGWCCSPYALGAALPMLTIMFGGQRLARRFAPRAVPIRAGIPRQGPDDSGRPHARVRVREDLTACARP